MWAFRQGQIGNRHPDQIKEAFEHYRDQTLQEKLYVHLDRQFYLAGETAWFKVYYVDGANHRALDMSKVVYLEVIDDNKNPLVQVKVALSKGAGEGTMNFPVSLNSGHYLVRAYTNWMKNFSPDFFFKTTITIVNPFKILGLTVAKNEKHWDAQFLPEGGNMLVGAESTVAFKVIDETGKGLDFQGKILDDNDSSRVVAHFAPLKFGIGKFTFTPAEGHSYTAALIDKDSLVQHFKLPQPYTSGLLMHVGRRDDDGIAIDVTGTGEMANSPVYLLAQCRGAIDFSKSGNLSNGKASFFVPHGNLGEGIVQLTLFDGEGLPRCERLVFNRPKDQLDIQAKTDKASYLQREKVTIDLGAKLKSIDTLTANLSMSVFLDDSLQHVQNQDIVSYLLLSSDLKGQIEDPGYYFEKEDQQIDEALDNLMLTQGWRRFTWQAVLEDTVPEMHYVPEFRGQIVRGTVEHKGTHQPVADTMVYFSIPSRQAQFYSSKSDLHGNIQFELKNFYGQKQAILRPEFDVANKYEIKLRPDFLEKSTDYKLPPFFISAGHAEYIRQGSLNMQVADAYKEVNPAPTVALPSDTSNFYGQPDERYYLDDYVRFPVMEEVMREYVAGVLVRKKKDEFHFRVIDLPHKSIFGEDPLVLLDGVPVFDIDQIMAFDPLKIQRLDVMKSEYFYGATSYDGVVSYSTYRGDLAGFEFKGNATVVDYRGLQPQREFYTPKYDTEVDLKSRLPDFRNLIYWKPDIFVDGQGHVKLQFFASDQVGRYVVHVEGITADGHPGSANAAFQVVLRQQQP